MSNQYIEITTFDTNLISGSKDKTRNMLGGYWHLTSSEELGDGLVYSSAPVSAEGVPVEPLHSDEFTLLADATWVTASANSILPNYKFPMRFIGNPDVVKDDTHWATILQGGTWGTSSYGGAISQGVFDVHNFYIRTSFSKLDAKNIRPSSPESYDYHEIQAHYRDFYPEYEEYTARLNNELLMPSLYILEMYKQKYEHDEFDQEMTDFITLERNRMNPHEIMDEQNTTMVPPYVVSELSVDLTSVDTYRDKTINLRNYLTGVYVQTELSAATQNYILTRTSNLLFGKEAIHDYRDTMIASDVELMPYYVSIDIPCIADNSLKSIFSEYDFEDIFLSSLRAHFASSDISATSVKQYPLITRTQNDTLVSGSIVPLVTTTNQQYRTLDFMEMMTNCLNSSPFPALGDQYNFEPLTADTLFLRNNEGAYRFRRSTATMGTMNAMLDLIHAESAALPCVSGSTVNYVNFLKMAQNINDSATLAYRIEKVNSSDSRTVQNIFFYNDTDYTGNRLKYYDTQVKYGDIYTYNVYQYVLVKGYNYRYSDAIATRLIGDTSLGQDNFLSTWLASAASLEGEELRDAVATAFGSAYADSFMEITTTATNCLEFYDLTSGTPRNQLYHTEDENVLLQFASNAITEGTVTNAQIVSEHRYLADLYVTIEPSWQIMEVPIATKRLSVLDHVPTAPDITPYQRLDDSQIIGFYANLESFTKKIHPKYINEETESIYMDNYLWSNNKLKTEKLDYRSVSRVGSLEVYRIDHKPRSYADFMGKLVATKDLSMPIYKSTQTNCFHEEKVRTNKKYYYLFRFVNQHNIPGYLSPVYEAELINDGGYKYSKFKVIYETEFEQSNDVQVSETFKKLMRIVPNARHVILDDSSVNYSEEASANLSNVKIGSDAQDTIWGTPFKIRLTSKKTGKKIDLNITYRMRESSS